MADARVARLSGQLAAATEPERRHRLLADLERSTATDGVTGPVLVAAVVEAMVREVPGDGLPAARLQPIFALYEAVLRRAGEAAGGPLRALLAGPPLRLARVGEWCDGAKLVALSVLTPLLCPADAPLLGALAQSSAEPLAVRHRAGRLWWRVAGDAVALDLARLAMLSLPEAPEERDDWLHELREPLVAGLTELAREPRPSVARQAEILLARCTAPPDAPSEPGFASQAREVQQLLAQPGGRQALAPWEVYRLRARASAELMEWLYRCLQGEEAGRVGAALAMAAIRDCHGPWRWCRVPGNRARVVDALLANQHPSALGALSREAPMEALLTVVCDGPPLPLDLCRRLLLALEPSPAMHRRDALLARLVPSLGCDAPLLAHLAGALRNPLELRRTALHWWLVLDPAGATPAVRQAVLRSELDPPAALRQQPGHLDWVLSALTTDSLRVREPGRWWSSVAGRRWRR